MGEKDYDQENERGMRKRRLKNGRRLDFDSCLFVKSVVHFPRMSRLLPIPLLALTLAAAGCLNVKTEPIEVRPIHITVDVNVKIDRALDDFFGDLDKKSSTLD